MASSAASYESVFGWRADLRYGSFDAPGLIGQWSTDLSPAESAGPVLWINVEQMQVALVGIGDHGGAVRTRPWPVVRAPTPQPPEGAGNGPSHRENWVLDPDGYTVVVAGPDGESWELDPA